MSSTSTQPLAKSIPPQTGHCWKVIHYLPEDTHSPKNYRFSTQLGQFCYGVKSSTTILSLAKSVSSSHRSLLKGDLSPPWGHKNKHQTKWLIFNSCHRTVNTVNVMGLWTIQQHSHWLSLLPPQTDHCWRVTCHLHEGTKINIKQNY